jgi:hypothetical protein
MRHYIDPDTMNLHDLAFLPEWMEEYKLPEIEEEETEELSFEELNFD